MKAPGSQSPCRYPRPTISKDSSSGPYLKRRPGRCARGLLSKSCADRMIEPREAAESATPPGAACEPSKQPGLDCPNGCLGTVCNRGFTDNLLHVLLDGIDAYCQR